MFQDLAMFDQPGSPKTASMCFKPRKQWWVPSPIIGNLQAWKVLPKVFLFNNSSVIYSPCEKFHCTREINIGAVEHWLGSMPSRGKIRAPVNIDAQWVGSVIPVPTVLTSEYAYGIVGRISHVNV